MISSKLPSPSDLYTPDAFFSVCEFTKTIFVSYLQSILTEIEKKSKSDPLIYRQILTFSKFSLPTNKLICIIIISVSQHQTLLVK